eukprot:TRINITY_DN349_c0_g1_i2.p1 TRINITY_DN349_c0_g1~~TRINITY_DN349_c0_g1_i2.p1  ORF type:complete len:131 (-),score=8.00 TRINITY_DN349_c0_g1_i2:478-870(-)
MNSHVILQIIDPYLDSKSRVQLLILCKQSFDMFCRITRKLSVSNDISFNHFTYLRTLTLTSLTIDLKSHIPHLTRVHELTIVTGNKHDIVSKAFIESVVLLKGLKRLTVGPVMENASPLSRFVFLESSSE